MINKRTKEETKEHNPNWPQILDHPYGILTVRDFGSGKRDSLFNLISQQPDIKFIYLLKIHTKQNINFYLINWKVQAQSI